ncbi:hypothetical protein FGO68_gene10545 [Halteria grandinella]|uniref:Uncharacterized protein n=1 Tax=Halteria grandinella TaxID=5974 RepID=A0A8J8N9F1_HALGN|nr:hypothetical protein FGO68_gene10545 [Halteria grandinella]
MYQQVGSNGNQFRVAESSSGKVFCNVVQLRIMYAIRSYYGRACLALRPGAITTGFWGVTNLTPSQGIRSTCPNQECYSPLTPINPPPS